MNIRYPSSLLPPLCCCLAAFLLAGCDMIEYHPYDLDIDGETGINAKNIRLIESALAGRKEISFAVISDTQRWYDETEDEVEAVNARHDIDFVIHTGDLSDFGLKLEFEKQRDILNRLDVPYVCLLGNHDCLGTGFDVYQKVFGSDNFAFMAGNVRFICLNTNALEYDYSHPVPNFDFMENELANWPQEAEKTIVAMHVPPGDDEFNNNVSRAFEHYVTTFPGLQFCLFGHVHNWREDEYFDDGVIYYGCASIGKKGYYVITIKENGYEIERCTF